MSVEVERPGSPRSLSWGRPVWGSPGCWLMPSSRSGSWAPSTPRRRLVLGRGQTVRRPGAPGHEPSWDLMWAGGRP